jgi:hypothetical protein
MIASLRSTRLTPVRAFVIVLFAFAMTQALRLDMLTERSAAQGVEATYHILWTATALAGSDPLAHSYLPTVTLAPEPGNPIRWGATVPTPGGAYVYTSFPPLGFLLPAAALQLSGSGSFLMLGLLNSLVGLVATLSLAGLARAMVLRIGAVHDGQGPDARRSDGWVVFVLCAVCYLFAREVLVSHGPVVWAHSLSQITLIAGCWWAFRIFTRRGSVGTVLGLALVAVVYPSLEWTGFVFNAGLFLALVYDGLRRQGGALALSAAAGVVLATLAAGAIMVLHFSAAIGTEALLDALRGRAAARDYSGGALLGLPLGYFVSFGALLPVAALGLWWMLSAPRDGGPDRSFWLLIFVASFPMLENVVMMQHAHQFSFDRLKLAVPLALICAMALWQARMPERSPLALLGLAAAVIWSNLQIFGHDVVYYKSWGSLHAANTRLADRLAQDPHADCGLYGTNGLVRGYMNVTLGRDIRETTTPEKLIQRRESAHGCGTIFVKTVSSPFADLPELVAIEVYDAQGIFLRRYEAY